MARCQFDSRQSELVRNITHVYQRAEPDDTVQGSRWYADAHRICHEWADEYGLSVETVACTVAALSPHLAWERNLVIAADILAERAPSIGGALHRNIAKAQQILRERATQTVSYMPYGPKVANFAENLAGNLEYVTVDTHCIQAALDDVMTRVALAWRPYTVFACAYAEVAKAQQLPPAILQAIVWHVWKRENPRVSKIQKRTHWVNIGTED